MLHKISIMFILMVMCAYGYQIDYKLLKVEVLPIYPAKTPIYEKEPVFIRFDIHIKENKTGLKKEILLESLKLIPSGENVILYDQEKYIHPEEKKLVIKSIVYYKQGENSFPFKLWFETEKLRSLLSENLLNLLSKKTLLEKQQPVYVSKIPYQNSYVGSFNIKTQLKGENGLATLTIKIEGKGFPNVPNYRLIVKNGTSRKLQFSIQNKMGYVESIQKFKISYMDEVEVLPLTFKFFDPYQEKLREIKTKTLKILPAEKKIKEEIKPLSEEERLKQEIEKFKYLYPEFFEEETFYRKLLTTVFIYRYYIIGFTTLALLLGLLILKNLLPNYTTSFIRNIISLELNSIEDFKKLYKFFPHKKLYLYLNRMEKLLFNAEIKEVKGRLIYIKSEGKIYTPKKIIKIFEDMKWEIIRESTDNLSTRKKMIIKLYYLLSKHSQTTLGIIFLLLITAVIQFFIEKFPQHWKILTFLNILVAIILILHITIIDKKVIKVNYDRANK